MLKLNLRKIINFLLILSVLFLTLSVASATVVDIPDANLKKAISEQLTSRAVNHDPEELTEENLEKLTYLTLHLKILKI